MNKNFEAWFYNEKLPQDIHDELTKISHDQEEIEARFSTPMQFGTAGLRSKMGVGISRMNTYTVAHTTQAFARMIIEEGGGSVVIAYDSRNNSRAFAEAAACVLAYNNIKVYLFESIRPTPELSFAILQLGCIAGINITASHNPKEYNGYKVYWSDGAQLPPEHAEKISALMDTINIFDVISIDYNEALKNGMITIIGSEIDSPYIEAVLKCRLNPEVIKKYGDSLDIVYTPIHGTGYKLVPEALNKAGISNLYVVEEQSIPDGNFPTVKSPNPEENECFNLSIDHIRNKELKTSFIIATDPDGDRLGVSLRDSNDVFMALSGNQIGAIMIDYIIKARKLNNNLPENACAIRSIVSSPLFDAICEDQGVLPMTVLTGFKYIGEKIKEFEVSGEHTFIFGYEESQGFLAGTYARDKDAVGASLLIAEAASFYKSEGKSLNDALEEIYKKYGYYGEMVVNINIDGTDPMKAMHEKMKLWRTADIDKINDFTVNRRRDYSDGIITNLKTSEITVTGLPKSNMLFFEIDGDTNIIIRPSGTEPKIKIYIQCRGGSEFETGEKLKSFRDAVRNL